MVPEEEIKVACDPRTTADELAAVEEAFCRAGFEVPVTRYFEATRGDTATWVIYVVLGTTIATFFSSFASEARKDGYAAVKQWAQDIRDARRGTGLLRLSDPEHSSLALRSSIPADALDALRDLDWAPSAAATSTGARSAVSGLTR